jgi:integrase
MKDLTTQFLNAVPLPQQGKRREYRDGNTTGLAMRVTAAGKKGQGSKTWVLLYSNPLSHKKCRLTIGPFPAITLARARELARQEKEIIAERRDPITERRKAAEEAARKAREMRTFGDVAADWVADRRAAKKRSLSNDEDNLRKWVLPQWRDREIGSIKRKEILELLQSVKVGTPTGKQANRVRSLLSTIFNYAVDLEIVERSPASRIKPLVKETPRKLQLLPRQIHDIWNAACAIEDERMRDCYKLLLLTCARAGEIRNLPWREIDLDAKEWLRASDRDAKNDRAWTVPLPPAAVELLRERKERAGDADVLVLGTRLTKQQLHEFHVGFKSKVGINFRLHDWRSVGLSQMEKEFGLSAIVRERILGHVRKGGISDTEYNSHDYLAQHRVALARWQSWLNDEEMPSNVVPLRPASVA